MPFVDTWDRCTRASRRSVVAGAFCAPAALLAACGQVGEQGTGSAPLAGAQPATVQFYFSGDQPTTQLYTTLKEGFERAHPKYTLELVQGENEIEKLLTLMAAGTPTDVFWNRVRTSQVIIRRDAAVDLLPLMKRDKVSQDDFWPSAVRAYTYQGGYYGLPTSSSSNAVYFNKHHFRQVGLALPDELEKAGKWDWDALLDTSRKLTRTDSGGKKIWGFNRPTGLVLTVQYMWQNGGKPFSDDRTQCLVNSPECLGAVQFITDLVLRHQVTAPVTDPAGANFRVNALVAMEQAGRFLLPEATGAMQSGAIDPGMVVAPKGPKAATTRGDDLAATVLKGTKVVDAAWAFAQYWASEEGQLVVLKSNRSYTSRRSIARNQTILKQVLNPWEDGETYFTGLNRTDVFPITPKFIPQVADIFAREERLAHAGEKTVKAAMDTVVQEVTPLLKEPF
ncbi:MAG: sugar ABC transporter substrate-binding protein [Chloroflexota bacterium]|nr:sugar ABC transporter substrate-binding protein [Chloroflexota bacterium]